MPIERKKVPEFLNLAKTLPVLDVRSPGEFQHAHMPGAFSFPIFDNDERKEIGTAYKQISRERAIKIGLDYFGKKMVHVVEQAERIVSENRYANKTVLVHCWRGGMRSAAIAWLLDLYGFKVYLLEGGYKAYRQWVLQVFQAPINFSIISGYTGSNKTGILAELKLRHERTIDLEALASHKGSAFGSLGMPLQPSQEMFENLLAQELWPLLSSDSSSKIWIEDESQRIGNVNIPTPVFARMREQAILFLDIPFDERLNFITEAYGQHEKNKLIEATERIKKKLGLPETKAVVEFFELGNTKDAFAILLQYYDRLYKKSSRKRTNFEKNSVKIERPNTQAGTNAEQLLQHVGKQT